jgi:hypothetical protein
MVDGNLIITDEIESKKADLGVFNTKSESEDLKAISIFEKEKILCGWKWNRTIEIS